MKSRNVLCLNHTGALGGASLALSNMLEPLMAGECHVWILTPFGPVAQRYTAQGATVIAWKPPAIYWLGRSTFSSGRLRVSIGYILDIMRTPWRIVAAAKKIVSLIDAQHIDTIYVNTMVLFPLGNMLARLRRKYGIKVIWHVRELLNPELPRWVHRWVVDSISNASDVVLSISQATSLPFAEKCTPVWDGNRVGAEWIASCNTERHTHTTGMQNVVMAASFLPGKGIPDFLRLARMIHEEDTEANFTLYTSRPVLPTRVERWAVSSLVRWGESARTVADLWSCHSTLTIDGYLTVIFDHRVVPEDLYRASVLVNPDASGVTWGRVVIEAMCAGIPVVSYGSSQEYVLDGITGYLVLPGQFEGLLERVRGLLADQRKGIKMGEQGRVRIAQLYKTNGDSLERTFGIAPCESTPTPNTSASRRNWHNE